MMDATITMDGLFKLLALVLPAIFAFMAVKYGLQQVVKDVAELKLKTESKDDQHDKQIADHNTRLSVLEVRFDETIKAMKAEVSAIYEKLIGRH